MKTCLSFLDIYLVIEGDESSIISIQYSNNPCDESCTKTSEVYKAKVQLEEYLQCKRESFSLNLSYSVPIFTNKVLLAMKDIEYGKIITYAKLAQKVGNPKANRAIGNVCNKNQFVIVIPCHRVVRSDGTLGGYQPGLKYKEYLLKLESKEDDLNG